MPSKYLFLSNLQVASKTGGSVIWNNLPVLSEATRECYVSILDMDVVFSATITGDEINVKCQLPSLNFFSSNNDLPNLRYLFSNDKKVFTTNLEASVELLTNDNVKRFEVQLYNSAGVLITNAIESINVTLKFDYVDQQEMTQQYLSQKPRTL